MQRARCTSGRAPTDPCRACGKPPGLPESGGIEPPRAPRTASSTRGREASLPDCAEGADKLTSGARQPRRCGRP
ncbi:hypothetical protein ADL19_06825 [Streptomyces purpurogeneiscleroticus]|nr:hypothetical protein ADL19_06825 [Streptomyces purpurogeneiscleroticus]